MQQEEPKKEEVKEEPKKFNLELTELEVQSDIAELQKDEEVNLYLKVQNGAAKFERYKKLAKLLEKPVEEKKVY